MKINGRLLLLVAVAALFVRVWTVNEPTRGRYAPRTRVHASRPVVLVPAPARDEAIAVVPVSVAQAPESALPEEREWSATDCPLPLPAGIAPGTYRVASDDGRIARLVVPVAHDAAASTGTCLDFLAVTIDGVRWYFIRLNVAAVVAEEIPAPAPVVAEGAPVEAIVADTPDVSPGVPAVIQQAERPQPPALPSPL